MWLHCRDTTLLGGHCCPSPQYHSRSTLDSTPPTWPFDTLGTCKQAGKMARLWGGLQACFRLHQSYNKTRFLYSCCTHHLEVSHFYYSCFFFVVIIVPVNKTIIQTIGTASFFINAVLACWENCTCSDIRPRSDRWIRSSNQLNIHWRKLTTQLALFKMTYQSASALIWTPSKADVGISMQFSTELNK